MRAGAKNLYKNYRIPTSMIAVLVWMLFFSCSNAQNITSGEKILIVYLSRTKNTKAVAEMIQKKTGGKLVELKKKDPYPSNYDKIVEQVAKENREGFLPELKTSIENLESFDTIFLGFPTWGMQMPPPMKSFLKQTDLSEKTLIPFNTNAGFGVGQGFNQVKEYSSNSRILKGFSVEGGYEKKGVFLAIKNQRAIEVEKEVENWLQNLNIIKK